MGGGARGLPTRRLGYTGGVPKTRFFPTHRCNPHIQLTGEIISSICSIAERPTAAGILSGAFFASCPLDDIRRPVKKIFCRAADRCWHSVRGLLRELPPGRYSAACQENFL